MNDYLIKELINDYMEGCITWHDIQDIVEGQLIMQEGGGTAYYSLPLKQRIAEENKILEKIERGLK
jgi:hypothetical protein